MINWLTSKFNNMAPIFFSKNVKKFINTDCERIKICTATIQSYNGKKIVAYIKNINHILRAISPKQAYELGPNWAQIAFHRQRISSPV